MRKFFAGAFALALTAALLTGCRGNVSNHKGGKITDPTVMTEPIMTEPMMTDPVVTMPSTDTTPAITTQPPTTHATDPTDETSTESTGNSMDPGTTDAKSRPNSRGMN